METSLWIERLYNDESLTSNIEDDDAEQLLQWSESHLATCGSEVEALRLFDALRLLNRYVGEGESFEQLLAALRANMLRSEGELAVPRRPEDLGPEVESIYPPDA